MADYKKLEAAGINMESLLRRLMGNESLVRVFIKKFLEDQTYRSLIAAFEKKDMQQAEIASHTLKGMCGNLSLDMLYRLFTDQVQLLRSREYEKAENMMGDISAAYEKTVSEMEGWLKAE